MKLVHYFLFMLISYRQLRHLIVTILSSDYEAQYRTHLKCTKQLTNFMAKLSELTMRPSEVKNGDKMTLQSC